MLGEDVGSRGRFLLLGNCSCIALLHAILGVMQNLHSHHPWRLAAAKPPWMGLRRSSTGIPHTLKSAKLLNLGIAAQIGLTEHLSEEACLCPTRLQHKTHQTTPTNIIADITKTFIPQAITQSDRRSSIISATRFLT